MAFDPVTAALQVGELLIERLWPDPAQRDAAKLKLLEMQQSGELAELAAEMEVVKAQSAINVAEAQSNSAFRSNWRPLVGWLCAAGAGWQFVLLPFLTFIFNAFGNPVEMPAFDTNEMIGMLTAMLGIAGLRSADKAQLIKARIRQDEVNNAG